MKNKFYTIWISLILIIIFILQIFINGFTDLFVLNNLAYSQYWRFLTSIFLHSDITHLLFNLFALLFFGLSLERFLGSKRFLLIFLTSGIIANVIAVNFYESSLGASGAIYGIIGALTIISPFIMVWAFGLIMPLFVMSILYVTADVLRTLGAFGPSNIGSIAHLSGIVIGMIFGFLFKKRRIKQLRSKININEHILKNWEDNYMR